MKKFLLLFITLSNTVTFGQCIIEVNSSSCSGGNAFIQILSGEIYDQYQWYFMPVGSSGGFQPITGAINPSLTCDWSTYNQNYIKLECYYNGIPYFFSNTLLLNLDNCNLGVLNEHLSKLTIFPNPVHDYFLLSDFETLDQIEIFNAIGQRVFTSKKLASAKIDTSSLTDGIYILRATSGKDSKQIKFIKL